MSYEYGRAVWPPNGEMVSWLDNRDDLLLEPETAYATAKRLASQQGISLGISQRTLWKRLAEKEMLASTDPHQNTVR